MNPMNLTGQKIFVTGGSRGIGAAIVQRLAELGATVAFTYSSQEAAAQSVLEKLPGSGHRIFKLDISQSTEVDAVCEGVIQAFGNIDGVVNNAGITKDQLLLRMKNEDFEKVVQANLSGTFYVTKAFSKHMLKARKGAFVNISSVIGSSGNPGQSNYAASKAGIEGFTRSVALELSSRHIRANTIAPGYIKSDMTNALSEDQIKAFAEKIPLGRPGEAIDVANCVAFLLSDAAAYITGQTLHVNGGLYLS